MRARLGLAAGALCALAALAAPAAAAVPLEVRIREAALDTDGRVELVVSVTGDAVDRALTAADFAVTEEGRPVEGVRVEPLLASLRPVAVALAVDVSGSTAGRPLADAKAAAKTFVRQLPEGVRIAVIAFGPRAQVRLPFSTDRTLLARTIDGLRPGGDTALYDAIVLAASTLKRTDAQHNIVLFSDGKDTVSKATLAGAIDAAGEVEAPVTSVGLLTRDFDGDSLEALARQTEGQTLRVGQSAQLSDAFARVANDIASQYVLTYSEKRTEPRELDLAVTARISGSRVSDEIVVLNPRTVPPPISDDAPPAPARPPVPAFASKAGLYVGLGAAFAGLAVFLGVLLRRPGEATRVLQRGLRLYSKSTRRAAKEERSAAGGIAGSVLGRKAVELIERVPRSERFQKGLQHMLDRAGWPFRATEFLIIQVLAFAGAAIVGFALLQPWWLGLILAAGGLAVPRVVLARAAERRGNQFLAQLPDTLQLLAGSLKAGYAFLQAIDTLVRESPQPTSAEFSRVLSEARLGMPLDDALRAMAHRLGSDDFNWVVLAINIQRQVGGNLAALLETVANTLRDREQVRRQIKVLSAEGRLSGVILTILPFGLAGYIMMVNPGYLNSLFRETFGKMLIAGALVLMGVGIAWMRKIVKIDV